MAAATTMARLGSAAGPSPGSRGCAEKATGDETAQISPATSSVPRPHLPGRQVASLVVSNERRDPGTSRNLDRPVSETG